MNKYLEKYTKEYLLNFTTVVLLIYDLFIMVTEIMFLIPDYFKIQEPYYSLFSLLPSIWIISIITLFLLALINNSRDV